MPLYYIPGQGDFNFPAGTTEEDAYHAAGVPLPDKAIVCKDWQTRQRFPSVRCDQPTEQSVDRTLGGATSDNSADVILSLLILLSACAGLFVLFTVSSRRIDRRKSKMEASGHTSSKWAHEGLIWLIPLLVFWRRNALGWGWAKVTAFLIWSMSAGLLSNIAVALMFPGLDGFGSYVVRVLIYGLLAVIFCLLEREFPDKTQALRPAPPSSGPAPVDSSSTSDNKPVLPTLDPYVVAGEEVLSGNVDAGLWARALVQGGGNDGPVRAAYVAARVAELGQQQARLRTIPLESEMPSASPMAVDGDSTQINSPAASGAPERFAEKDASESQPRVYPDELARLTSNPLQTVNDCVAALLATGCAVKVIQGGWRVNGAAIGNKFVGNVAALRRLASSNRARFLLNAI